ncbi:MAG: penicillin-binding protein 2 [Candidatus Alcyoniella australis]|nr:penicillin-binding protein 2 [Candidatus Alcyoniella australis]
MSNLRQTQFETQQDEAQHLRSSLFYAVAVLLLAFALLAGRLWHLQVMRGEELAQMAEQNRMRTLQLAPTRGKVLDREGRIIVDNGLSFDVYFLPKRLASEERESFLRRACATFGLNPQRALAQLERSGSAPIRIAADVDREVVGQVMHGQMLSEEPYALDIKQETKRVYPEGGLMSQALGYCRRVTTPGYDDLSHSEYEGRSGLELIYNEYLCGEDGFEQVEENALGRRIRTLRRKDPTPGHDLQLYVDLDLQRVMAEAMGNRPGAAVALDPRNGAVLAMHSGPTYDASVFSRFLDPEDWQSLMSDPHRPLMNRNIHGCYPPGSTFKPVIGTAALAEKIITPSTQVHCPGGWKLGNRFFRCWLRTGHGAVNFHNAMVQSCDTYFYRVGHSVGIDTISRYARMFGYGRLSGIDLPSEVTGTVPDRDWKAKHFPDNPRWYPGDTLNTSIGQGYLLASPLQLAVAFAAIANNGAIYKPQLAWRMLDLHGNVMRNFSSEQVGQLDVSPQVLERVHNSLVGVVNDAHGTGRIARMRNITVAGKTGTAQASAKRLTMPDGSTIVERGDHAWFACYAPAEDPQIVVVVLIERAGHGGSLAAPVAKKVLEAYFDKQEPRHEP